MAKAEYPTQAKKFDVRESTCLRCFVELHHLNPKIDWSNYLITAHRWEVGDCPKHGEGQDFIKPCRSN